MYITRHPSTTLIIAPTAEPSAINVDDENVLHCAVQSKISKDSKIVAMVRKLLPVDLRSAAKNYSSSLLEYGIQF